LAIAVTSVFSFFFTCGKTSAQKIQKPFFNIGFNQTIGESQTLKSLWLNPTLWYNKTQDSLQRAGIFLQEEDLRFQIQNFALRFIGRPYRNSGKSPLTGFDCSGFTGYIFRNFGLRLKASSTGQAMEGKKVSVQKASVGDLAFFGRKGRKGRMLVNHAAIVISKPGEPLEIIHSASNKGIVITKVSESRYWKNSLLFVRNVIKS
jgi:hypothetical protein